MGRGLWSAGACAASRGRRWYGAMSVLWLVRHGQASVGSADYDRLSPLGHEQSRLLGHQFADWGLAFDEVFVGPRRRHRETWDAVAAAYRARGLDVPEPLTLDALDEFPASEVFESLLPRLRESDPEVRALAEGDAEPGSMERLFQVVCRAWARAHVQDPTIETWSAFRERVSAAFAEMTDGMRRGRTIAA